MTDQLRDLELIEKSVSSGAAAAHSGEPLVPTDDSTIRTIPTDESPEPEWKVNTNYSIGDRIRHLGLIYQCIQAHKSQSDWEPQLTPALWKVVGATIPDPPEVDVPLYRKRTLLLPVEADLKSILSKSAEEKQKEDEARRKAAEDDEKEADEILNKHADLQKAIAELVKLHPDNFEVKPSEEHPGFDVDPKFTRDRVVGEQLEYRSSLRKIALGRAGIVDPTVLSADANPATSARPEGIRVSAVDDVPTQPVSTEPTGAFNLAKDLLSSVGLLGSKGLFIPVSAIDRTPRLKDTAATGLSDLTKGVLKARGINIIERPVTG